MKNALLAMFLVLASCCYSQSYKPFLNDSAHWWISTFSCDGPCDAGNITNPNNLYSETNEHYKIGDDTVLNGKIYKRFFSTSRIYNYRYSQQGTQVPNGPVIFVSCQLKGILREDTLARKVYMYNADGTPAATGMSWCIKDSTLFDFSRQQGDTMYWQASCSDTAFIVDTITYEHYIFDSVKTWHLRPAHQSYFGKILLYESIGADCGFYGGKPGFEGAFQTNLENYCIGNDSVCGFSCTPPLGIKNISRLADIKIFPNPVNNTLNIEVITADPITQYNMTLLDITGRTVYGGRLISDTSIDLSGIATGLYLWYLAGDGQVLRSGKLSKE